MPVPCVRVRREEGETTRRALADDGVVDDGHDIVVEDGWLFIPVSSADAVPEGYTVVDRDAPRRASQTSPADLLGYEPSYERLGDIAIVDEDDADHAAALARALLDSDLPVRTVVNRASKIKGDLRVREWELLATRDGSEAPTETVHREYGYEYLLDISTVYFSPRLATERRRVTTQVTPDERAVDMFAGVGPFVVPMADRGTEVVGVDLNPDAVAYLRENSRRNGVEERVTAREGDVREVAGDYADTADRIVMNLPHSADEFLDTAVALAGDACTLHYYDIQHDADPFGPGVEAIRATAEPAGYEVTVETEQVVRSYAPHELNVCLDVSLTRTR